MNEVYVIGRDSVPEDIILQEGERLDITLIVLPGVSADVPLRISLAGPGAEVNVRGLYICTGEEKLSFNVNLRHESGDCNSRQLFKGIVGGEARADFYGLIYVKQDAQHTEAYQENHNILLTDTAVVETRPQLEIYADDVKCSHGATVGRLNEDELFYMRSRGIPEDEARVLQMISFISPVLDCVQDEELKQQIYDCLSEC